MNKIAIWILLDILMISTTVYAASPWTEEKTYADKVSAKFQFGLTNVMLGWTEILAEPEKAAGQNKNALLAVGKGLLYFPVDTVGGLLHLVTAPIPQIDIPLPDNGVTA